MLEKSNLSKRRQDTSDLPYEAEGLLGCGHHLADLLHAGAQGLLQHPGDGEAGLSLALTCRPGSPQTFAKASQAFSSLRMVSACFHMAGHLGSSLRGKRSVSWVLELSQVLEDGGVLEVHEGGQTCLLTSLL